MPTDEYNADDRQAQLPPPLDEDLDSRDVRLARAKAVLWTGLTAEEKIAVIHGELMLGQRRRRTMGDWLSIGQAVVLLDREVFRQAEASSGDRYNREWKKLAPDQIQQMSATNRSYARWLWINREDVQRWWDTEVPAEKKDKWGHPLTIKLQYEKAHPAPVDGTLPVLQERTGPRVPVNIHPTRVEILEDATRTYVETSEIIYDARDQLGAAAAEINRTVRDLDLSTPEAAATSAQDFWAKYRDYGVEKVRWFIAALERELEFPDGFPPEDMPPRFRRRNPPPPPPPNRFTRGN